MIELAPFAKTPEDQACGHRTLGGVNAVHVTGRFDVFDRRSQLDASAVRLGSQQ
jgi:hypothetical protein